MDYKDLDIVEKPKRGDIDTVENCLADIQASRRQVLKTGLVGLLAGLAPMVIPSATEAGRS